MPSSEVLGEAGCKVSRSYGLPPPHHAHTCVISGISAELGEKTRTEAARSRKWFRSLPNLSVVEKDQLKITWVKQPITRTAIGSDRLFLEFIYRGQECVKPLLSAVNREDNKCVTNRYFYTKMIART